MTVADQRFHGMKKKPKKGAPRKPKSNWYKKAIEQRAEKLAAGYSFDLTQKQAEVFLVVRLWQYERRYSPSLVELQSVMPHLSLSAVRDRIAAVVKKGYLERARTPFVKDSIRPFLFPKNLLFPWHDTIQFPTNIFIVPKDHDTSNWGSKPYSQPIDVRNHEHLPGTSLKEVRFQP